MPMSEAHELTRVPVAVAHMLAEGGSADLSIYLPGRDGRNPVLYRAPESNERRPDYRALEEHGIDYLLVRDSELGKCEQLLEENLSHLIHDPAVEPACKADCVHYTGTSVARDLSSGIERDESRLQLTDLELAQHFGVEGEARDGNGVRLDLRRIAGVLEVVIDGILSDSAVAAHLLQVSGSHQSTASHLFSVSSLSILLGAEVIGSDREQLKELGLAGVLHDLGKITIDPEVLNKETPLTAQEVQLIQHHPIESVRLLGDDPRATPAVRETILQHHERVDGRGYPLGLFGPDIRKEAKILAIADSFHALTGKRSYRAPLTPREAIRVMRCHVGKQFDPDLFGAWEKLFEQSWRKYPRRLAANDDGPCEEVSYHRDHYSAPRRQRTPRRRSRLNCQERAKVKWIYSGRLLDEEVDPNEFTSRLHDLSPCGLCMYTDHPMYRGELIHLLVASQENQVWVRGIVRWCRRDPSDRCFMTGVEFLQRISADEAPMKLTVKGMDDHILFPVG